MEVPVHGGGAGRYGRAGRQPGGDGRAGLIPGGGAHEDSEQCKEGARRGLRALSGRAGAAGLERGARPLCHPQLDPRDDPAA